jgi:hypothetical protein
MNIAPGTPGCEAAGEERTGAGHGHRSTSGPRSPVSGFYPRLGQEGSRSRSERLSSACHRHYARLRYKAFVTPEAGDEGGNQARGCFQVGEVNHFDG